MILGLILLLLMRNVPSAQATIEYKSITPTNRDTLLEEVRNKPGAESREENGALRIKVPSEGKFYFFTLEKHPTHPSVVIRHVFEKNGAIWIEDTGFTAGDKKIFEQWLRQFEESQKASRRGVATLHNWVLADYLAHDYVTARPLSTNGGKNGLWCTLYAALRANEEHTPYI